jgi:hypothetical protein
MMVMDDGQARFYLLMKKSKTLADWHFQFGARQDEWRTDCMTVADIIPFARSPEI